MPALRALLKILRPESLSDPSMRFRFERESRAVARIRHPGVVALHDRGELPDGGVFLVLELLSGLDLETVLSRFGRGTAAQVASLVGQLGEALAAAHAAQVIHRDLTPGNVFLVPDGPGFAAKLVDFGIARSTRRQERVTQTGMIVGTPAYMSPEQVRGWELDERTDVYSLAAVTYEALVGQPPIPVRSGGVTEMLLDVVSVEPPAAGRILPGLPPEVDAVLALGLAKRREDRPGDVRVFSERCAALLAALPGEGSGGWPPTALLDEGRAPPR